MLLAILLGFMVVITPTNSARILGIVSTPSYSHQIVFRPIWKELSLRGHELTVLTTDPMNDLTLTNLTEIDMSISYKKWQKMNVNEMSKLNIFEQLDHFQMLSYDMVEEQLLLPKVQELLRNEKERFDLVMVELVFPGMAAFAERFNCPMIQIFSLDAETENYHLFGNPSHPVLNPDFMLAYGESLNFFQRLVSTLYTVAMKYIFTYQWLPIQDALIRKHFGSNYPSIREILQRSSMLFVNTDTVFHPLRPLLPNIIQFGGGTHLTPVKPLPKDLQVQLDNATNGFIYFSLGSNVKSELLPESTRRMFLETFSELPYTVLWKFETQDLSGKPDNVIISKWFPQQDIFSHPNIKLFITQGGLQSTEEAIYNHIPMIGIPFFADQESNVQRVVNKGIALSLNRDTIDKASLKATILKVLTDPSYSNRVKELAELAKDQPMTGIERAVWWTEYTIRHKGAKHLRSPAMDLPTYQYFLLDVIGFCLAILLVVVYILVKLTKLIYRLIRHFVPKSKVKVR